jgi:hypothetical protein
LGHGSDCGREMRRFRDSPPRRRRVETTSASLPPHRGQWAPYVRRALSQTWKEKETQVDASSKLSPGMNSWSTRDSDAITILPSDNLTVLHSQIDMDTTTDSIQKASTPAQGITDVASIPHVIAITPSVQDMSYINTSGSPSEVQAVSVRNQPESTALFEASKIAQNPPLSVQLSQAKDLPPSSVATQNNDAGESCLEGG